MTSDSSLIMDTIDGEEWETSFSQPIGYFRGVSARAASDVWAVGGTSWSGASQTLAEHWNGTTWSRVTTPTPGSGVLNGVVATSASNAWAVGVIGPGSGTPSLATEPLIEHWDGTSWTEQTFADPDDGGQFWAVAATSASDAWAVGQTGESGEGSGQTTLIDRWDGTSWTRVTSPNPTGSASILYGVTAISATDAWAVGQTLASDGHDKSLTMHWDGSTWTVVTSPNPTGDTTLSAVASAGTDYVWAVGTECGGDLRAQCGTFAMRWNGSTWTQYWTPNRATSYRNSLFGVAALTPSLFWAVGTTEFTSAPGTPYPKTLIELGAGSSWTR